MTVLASRMVLYTDEDLDDDGVKTSPALNTARMSEAAIMLLVTHASGTPDVKIEWAPAPDDSAAAAAALNWEEITASTATDAGADAQKWLEYPVAFFSAPFLYVRFTEVSAGNLDDSVLNAYLEFREQT